MPTGEEDKRLLWQLNSINMAAHYLEGLQEVLNPFQQATAEMLAQLPDKGKYSLLLVQDTSSSQYYLIDEQKMFKADKTCYLKDKGLVVAA